ncbi:Type 1 glutamine amidotransferase-like domain-containing protein [Patescibacteria group bacterium]|nr:Type 1 glutamine amidotransferase-like domain-containing protein [Patescibacteria group bacterium]
MKLLLTSNGLSNNSIIQAFFELVDKKPEDTKIAFIPTAMNVECGDKSWFINDLVNTQKTGAIIDIVDISALKKDIYLPRLETADVLFFCGGNSYHLMRWIQESGLQEELSRLLETRIYVGISAGAMVTSPDLYLSNKDKSIYYEEMFNIKINEALGYVEFYIRPHFNSVHFPHANDENISKIATKTDNTIYGLDDNSAIKIDGELIEIISEGNWKKYN